MGPETANTYDAYATRAPYPIETVPVDCDNRLRKTLNVGILHAVLIPRATSLEWPMMVELTDSDDGVLLPVYAQPNARQDGITGMHDGRLKIAVTQAPERGKANKQLIRVLATSLGLKRSQIELLRGHTSSVKTFGISDVSKSELEARIAESLDE